MTALDDTSAELALRYLKHRWRGPVDAARAGTLTLADVDLDPDWGELQRAVGVAALEAMSLELLRTAGLPDDARPLRALAPELDPGAARGVLSLFALNVAFRLRTDATLGGLVGSLEAPGLPRPAADVVGGLLSRARSARAARALVAAAADVSQATREAVAAAVRPRPAPPAGARLHLEAEQEPATRALEAALRPRAPAAWSKAGSSARRLLMLRRTGGWITVLAEDEALERELAPRLARAGGVRRAAWSRFGGGEPDLLVHEGARALLDRAALEAQQGAPPDDDDVAGALRAMGVLDLDPDHPRGPTGLRFADHAGGGPPLGFERRLRKRGLRPLAFDV